MTNALATTDPGTLDQLRAVRNALAPDLNDQELQLFAMVAARSGLDPFAKQIYAVKRAGRVTFQTGIDGYRSIAARTGEYDGQDEPEFGPACACGADPKGHPEFATVRVHRKGMGRPVGATAYWHEYVPQGNQGQMWHRMPRVMLSKVAEALALRKAFPWDPNRGAGIGADLYTADEMAQADRTPTSTPSAAKPVSAAERVSQRRAAIEAGPVVEAEPQEPEAVAASFLDDAPPAPPAPMSQDELKARVKADGIDLVLAERVFHETFPDAESLGSLTDVDRGAYWAALEAVVAQEAATSAA